MNHLDLALRWSKSIGDWDIGLAHFSGTSREAALFPSNARPKPRLAPFYPQIDQTSLDAQATRGAWLWKLESIYNQNNFNNYYAYVAGFEFTQFGIADSASDLGWLLEYHYSDRSDEPTEELIPTNLQNDLYLGMRWTGNDMPGTQLLFGVLVDKDSRSTFGNLEYSRRLGELWPWGWKPASWAISTRGISFTRSGKTITSGLSSPATTRCRPARMGILAVLITAQMAGL